MRSISTQRNQNRGLRTPFLCTEDEVKTITEVLAYIRNRLTEMDDGYDDEQRLIVSREYKELVEFIVN